MKTETLTFKPEAEGDTDPALANLTLWLGLVETLGNRGLIDQDGLLLGIEQAARELNLKGPARAMVQEIKSRLLFKPLKQAA